MPMIAASLFVICLFIFIILLIYDQKVKSDRNAVLGALWEGALGNALIRTNVPKEDVVGVAVSKLQIMNNCDLPPSKIHLAIKKLADDMYIGVDGDTIQFTTYGASYYDFVVLAKMHKNG